LTPIPSPWHRDVFAELCQSVHRGLAAVGGGKAKPPQSILAIRRHFDVVKSFAVKKHEPECPASIPVAGLGRLAQMHKSSGVTMLGEHFLRSEQIPICVTRCGANEQKSNSHAKSTVEPGFGVFHFLSL